MGSQIKWGQELNGVRYKLNYYRFTGSLTTPPCSEGVAWFVLPKASTASAEQIEAFQHTMHHDNNRPVQPINARIIVK